MTKEIWKDIEGFEGYYKVSNLGRVYSIRARKIMRTYINNNGYECIDFTVDKVKTKHTVHRLVARAFCEGYREGLVVNHKDADRLNNTAYNLEWVTTKENIHDMIQRGTMNTENARNKLRKVLQKKVDMYTPDGKTYLKTFPSIKEAAASSGAHPTKITEVIKGRRFRAGGYHWKYNDPNDNYSYYTKDRAN